MMMRAAYAIFLDSYRALNARKLFWVSILISFMLVLAYASIGFQENGMSILFGVWSIEHDLITDTSPLRILVYRSIFTGMIVGLWLTWGATILALISTATIYPDFMAKGAVDMLLSKPVSRTALFLLQYLFSLLFVVVLVTIVTFGAFLCMGWRIGQWNWEIFLAVPIVTLFYSYLYCVCVLIGTMTRSAIAALLLTLLFWVLLFTLNMAEGILNSQRIEMGQQVVYAEQDVEPITARLDELEDDDSDAAIEESIRLGVTLVEQQRVVEDLRGWRDGFERWHRRLRWVQAPLPKTSQTVDLLDRWLTRTDDMSLNDLMMGRVVLTESGEFEVREDRRRAQEMELIESYQEISWWWIIGSSLGFNVAVLGIALGIFLRRDF